MQKSPGPTGTMRWNGEIPICFYRNAINRIRPIRNQSTRYLYYWLFNLKHAGYVDAIVAKTTIAHLTAEKLECVPWPDVPFAEQKRIAAYLDASCAAIDAAVSAKRRQIETLDVLRKEDINRAVTYGIDPNVALRSIEEDWIEQIPSRWQVCRIKRVLSRVDYGISQSTDKVGQYPVLKMGHIQDGEIVYNGIDFIDDVPEGLLLEPGDILYNRTNSSDQVAKAAVFRGDMGNGITFASYLVRLRANHRANPYFLNYVLNSTGFLTFARRLAIPSVQQSNLNSTRYCRMLIPLPPFQEQRKIVAFLDQKTALTRQVVDGILKQISILPAYRKSLIHECVTGQRRVTEEDVARVQGGKSLAVGPRQ
ncbi:MAG: restriction endonuclease subunit S [Thermodesulfobacteriota bacterium]